MGDEIKKKAYAGTDLGKFRQWPWTRRNKRENPNEEMGAGHQHKAPLVIGY